ncbi:MAG: neutral/alkaline non-lysosomal ceramidase N-terminal domain-containing protein [Bryobacteraceae bacterium]|nr:neutral/alkaline non-lysosomal ceramidase N-terminal domain-containing protein [Bryobacteraceae bacterium]
MTRIVVFEIFETMHFRLPIRTLGLLVAAMCGLPAADFQVGAAAVKITPPMGAPMSGYYYNRAADGVHDDLFAKALVFEQDGAKAAVVACDLSGVPRPIVEQARQAIEQKTGIPGARVMISATHTHTGPVLLSGATRYNLEGEMLAIGKKYAADLPQLIAEAVEKANAALAPARISAAKGREESLTFNRRFHMKDGRVGWNPGKLNPNIVRPAGPIDPDVPVVYFDSPGGKPIATYVNYALHLDTVGGLEYSADYPYTLGRQLSAVKGPGMLTLFTIGCAGNLNHIDVTTREPQKGHGEAARIGTVLAGEVLKTFKRLEHLPAAAPKVRSETVLLPLPAFEPRELEWAKKITPLFGKPNAAPFLDFVKAFRVTDTAARDGKPLEAEVQVIALGNDLAFVGLPGEIFTELGMALKYASPYRYTVVAELANGSVGYVPNRKAYPEGAYEAVSARCAEGSGEMLVQSATKLLVSLRSEQ